MLSYTSAGSQPYKWSLCPPSDTTQWAPSQGSVALVDLISLIAANLPPGVVVEVEGAGMHNPHPRTARSQLADLSPPEPCPQRWRWAIARLDAEGRVCLPDDALAALGATTAGRSVVRGTCNRVGQVLHRDGAAPLGVDGRGRVLVPVWLRQAAGDRGSLVVGTRPEDHVVIVAPVAVLDGLEDMLVGGVR